VNEPFVPIVIVDSAIAGEALATKHQLETLIGTVNRSSFDIADLLHLIKKRGYYAPFATFTDYRESLKIKPRRSQYLARMASVMEEVGIPRSQYEALGIERLRDITSLEPTEIWTNPITGIKTPMREFIIGFVEYRDEAGGLIDPKVLNKNIRTLKGFVGENDFVWLNLYVRKSALDNTMRPALELMKAHIGSVKKDDEGISQDASDGTSAEYIFAEYLTNPANGMDALNAEYDSNVLEVDELLSLQSEADKKELENGSV
jgi:hypothetical protein